MPQDLILHHYDFSNFSEKVRLVLGIKGLDWHSVETPSTLPKPDYVPLTGGYRRAPALQIGADVFCDTIRIIDELESRFPEPSVYPGPDKAAQRGMIAGLTRWTDALLTRNTINYISSLHIEADRFSPEFLADRAALFGRPEPTRAHRNAGLSKNLTQIRPQFEWLQDILSDERSFILGEKISLADCIIYHPLWIMDQLAGEPVGLIPNDIRAWLTRVASIGHGMPTAMTALDALNIAAESDPDPPRTSVVLEGDPEPLELVAVTPTDYGRASPSIGTLLSIDASRVTIQHSNERTGPVNVHFPRVGYSVKPTSP